MCPVSDHKVLEPSVALSGLVNFRLFIDHAIIKIYFFLNLPTDISQL